MQKSYHIVLVSGLLHSCLLETARLISKPITPWNHHGMVSSNKELRRRDVKTYSEEIGRLMTDLTHALRNQQRDTAAAKHQWGSEDQDARADGRSISGANGRRKSCCKAKHLAEAKANSAKSTVLRI